MVKAPPIAVAVATLAASAALAHHSPSAYNMAAQVTVEGTLAKVDWTNPHIYLTVETMGPNGQHALQQVESVSISVAQSMGLTRDALKLGSAVTVRGNPNRRGSGHTVLGAEIATSDGNVYALGGTGRASRPPAATVPAAGLAGNWAPKANPALLPTVHGWPLSDKARAVVAEVLSGRVQLSVGCSAVPPPMIMQLPPMRSIEVADDRVVIKIDADGSDGTRVVRLDLTDHPRDLVPTLFGHSIGRWEGATLVIDTVGFTAHELGIGFGVPGSAAKHMIERLTLTDNRLQLRYELTLEDAEYLAAPATYTALWDHRPDLAPSGAACDPEISERYRQD